MSMSHFIENTGEQTLRFLEPFRAPRFMDVSLAQWIALTPHELVAAHLKIDRAVLDGLRKDRLRSCPLQAGHTVTTGFVHQSKTVVTGSPG